MLTLHLQYICYNQTLPAILCPYDTNLRCGQACYAESRDTCITNANPPYLIGENLQPCGTTVIQEFDPIKVGGLFQKGGLKRLLT